jgi:hypothetical protein
MAVVAGRSTGSLERTMNGDEFGVDDFIRQTDTLIEALRDLTERGKAEWIRQTSDPGYVHCLVGGEWIKFEIHCGEPVEINHPTSAESIAGVGGTYRNVGLLWLPSTRNWNVLVKLLFNAPANDERYAELRKQAHRALFSEIFALWTSNDRSGNGAP